MRKIFLWIATFLIIISFSLAVTSSSSIDWLSKGYADTLYCKVTGCTINGNLTLIGYLINATIIQSNVTNLLNYYNKTETDTILASYLNLSGTNANKNIRIAPYNLTLSALFAQRISVNGTLTSSLYNYITAPALNTGFGLQGYTTQVEAGQGDIDTLGFGGGIGGTLSLKSGVGGAETSTANSGTGGTIQIMTGIGGTKTYFGSGSGSTGQGGTITMITASGGAMSGTTTGSSTGGIGGGFSALMGNGADANAGSATNTAGAGGSINLNGGNGGFASLGTTAIGGAGGSVSISSGTGGAALSASTRKGGNGGNIVISAGAGTNGNTTNGTGGQITIQSGSKATGASNGNIFLKVSSTEILRIMNTTDGIRLSETRKLYFNDTASIFWDGTNLRLSANMTGGNALVYSDTNISASGYITRTAINNDSNVLGEYNLGVNYYNPDGSINHSRLCPTSIITYQVVDYSRPSTTIQYRYENLTMQDGTIYEAIIPDMITTYPYTKQEEGCLMDKEVANFRQAFNVYHSASDVQQIQGIENPAFKTHSIVTDAVYTLSKLASENKSYIKEIAENDIYKKSSHYALVNGTLLNGTRIQMLDMEKRIAELEGINKQLVLLLCQKNILKKEDGCP